MQIHHDTVEEIVHLLKVCPMAYRIGGSTRHKNFFKDHIEGITKQAIANWLVSHVSD